MSKRAPKKRPKKKGPAPRRKEVAQTKKKWSGQQIGVAIIGVLVILSMSIGYLLAALR